VHSAQDTLTRVAAHKPGSTVAIKVVRGNTTVAVKAAVTERPPPS
jgi:S1-C subfamily serine protease